jgi:DNA (cytosine-5)-methyltransferase 1
MKHLDLFSGIGGFALASQWVGGIQTVRFVEIDPFCQKILAKNFPGIPTHDDIRQRVLDLERENAAR